MIEPVISTANPRIKQLVRLRGRRERDRTGSFLIEGFRELTRAVGAGIAIDEIFVCRDLWLGPNEEPLLKAARAAGATVIEVAEAPFRKASYRERPEGLLAVGRQFATAMDALEFSERALVLVVESIEKPGNLGTMLRSASAAGADAIVVCDPKTDPFNPNVVRASLGALFLVPMAVTTTHEAIEAMRHAGITTYAATPAGAADYDQADLTGPVAVVVGSEQYGLSKLWLDAADERVAIPMPGPMDSLNAAMAAGIILFEAVRQRRVA